PQLTAIRQPLAGEVATRRELLERMPFATGYGVEIAMLIDVWREGGREGIARVNREEHRNRHQPLAALEPMARTVLATIARRVEGEGRLTGGEVGEPAIERPPRMGLDGCAASGAPSVEGDGALSAGAPSVEGDGTSSAGAPPGR